MKIVLFLMAFALSIAQAQIGFTSPVATQNDTAITNRTFYFGQVDTTKMLDIRKYANVILGLMSKDTVVITVKYQLSLDGVMWTTPVLYDSLRQTTTAYTTKSVNLSTVALGHPYARCIMSITKSNVYGSTTYTSTRRKYWATLKTY